MSATSGFRVLVATLAAASFSAGAARIERITISRVFPNPGQLELSIANADGSDERRLLPAPGMDYDPVWSPDGATIVFTSERAGSADLYQVRPDGTSIDRLTDSPAYDDQAAFAPDGRRLVFVSTRGGGRANLWTLDLATRKTRALTSGPGGDFRPSWSPDGQWIAFSSDRDSNLPSAHGRWEHLQLADIFLIHPDGSGLKRLTPHGDFCGSPKWTADSRRLVAYCMTAEQTLENRRPSPDQPDSTRLVSVGVADGRLSEIGVTPGVNFDPSPLPGGAIGFVRKGINASLFAKTHPELPAAENAAGIYYSTGQRGPRGDVRAAAWSPDGKRVVFHKRVAFDRKPWTAEWSRNPGYELRLSYGGPSFSPAGDRFAFVAPGAAPGTLSTLPNSGPVGAGVGVAPANGDRYDVIYADKTRNILGPQWSPSGDAIVFGIGVYNAFFNGFHGLFLEPKDRVEGGAQIAMVKPDGSGFRELTKGPNNNSFPSMAPDGKRLVFRTFGPEGEGLRILDLTTDKVSTLTDGYDNFPLWSPRGDLVVFSRQAGGDYEIYSITPDGKTTKRLTYARGNDAHMAWSPDGEHIAFASSRMGFKDEAIYTDAPQPYGEIFVMRFDGSHVEQLTDNQWEEGTPAWQPTPALAAQSGRR
jgi:Tol biopolymer transport system component